MPGLSPSLLEALNQQMNAEFYSAYLYLGLAGQLEVDNWPGFARWMRVQAREELGHAMKIFDFLCQRGGRPSLLPIASPPAGPTSPQEAFRHAYEHEQEVTRRIHHLYALALEQGDYSTQVLLQWFVEEQVEEEDLTSEALARVERAQGNPAVLAFLDSQFGQREG